MELIYNGGENEFTGEYLNNLIKFKGAERAFIELRDRFGDITSRDIRGYLRRNYCPDPNSDGDEIEQDTWNFIYIDIEKYHKGKKLQDYTNPAGWIYRIRRRFCIKDIIAHRREANYISIDGIEIHDVRDESGLILHPFGNQIESGVYSKELLREVRRIFYGEPDNKKIAFELRMNGFDHDEIAFFLDITPELSRKWFSRMVKKIKEKASKF